MDDTVLTYMIYVSEDNDKPSITIKITGLDYKEDAEYVADQLDNLFNNQLKTISGSIH
tara:strand:+ start:705 stop:878 length:174 start_codon:yes stop_codon:yes gene_type:complete